MKRGRHTASQVPDDRQSADAHAVNVHLDRILAERGMTLAELAEVAGVTVVNLSVVKNGRARAVRFSTLTSLCRALDCQPGDLLTVGAAAADRDRRDVARQAEDGS